MAGTLPARQGVRVQRSQDGEERLVLAALTSAALLVVGQMVTSRSVLGHLEAAVWLVPTWAVWVLAGLVLVLRGGVLPLAAAVLSVLHGLQHLGWAVTETGHLVVEAGLAVVIGAALAQRVVVVRARQRADLVVYLREPLPPLGVPLRGAFAAYADTARR